MLWFFAKGAARLRIVTWLDETTGEYVVEVQWPDRGVEIQRFETESRCSEYLSTFESELTANDWIPAGVRLTDRPPTSH
jgi:hypothetical protein